MRRHLVLSILLFTSVFAVLVDHPVVAADLGGRYADAFILIQQGEAAEQKSDFEAALSCALRPSISFSTCDLFSLITAACD